MRSFSVLVLSVLTIILCVLSVFFIAKASVNFYGIEEHLPFSTLFFVHGNYYIFSFVSLLCMCLLFFYFNKSHNIFRINKIFIFIVVNFLFSLILFFVTVWAMYQPIFSL